MDLLNKTPVVEYNESLKKLVLITSLIANLGILFYFKYANWGIHILEGIFSGLNIQICIPTIDVLLPVGISFYTFQALSYTIDVYRGDIYAEKNIFRYALFVSFFPQLVAGPIERSKNLLKQLATPKKFNFGFFEEGILLMLWGFFLKIVLADRIAIFVDCIYENIDLYSGSYFFIAAVLFSIQIYCDFYGYSIIAMGAAKILGIQLMQNFDAPFLSTSISELWRKWHISLTSWFTDYLYIPLGGSRNGRLKKYKNIMIVFLVSGLWHGAAFTYVVWGGINGLYQIIGGLLKPIRNALVDLLRLKRESFGHRLVHIVCTFFLFTFSCIFFRSRTLTEANIIIKSLFTDYNPWIFFDGSLYNCGLNQKNFQLMIYCIVILLVVDIYKKRRVSLIDKIISQDVWFRVLLIASMIVLILLFGIWGDQYDATGFVYFQF